MNRARALTVKTVMNPPIARITVRTIGEALVLIEEALPDTLEADHHLPVVDEHGDLQGQLSRESLVEVFSEVNHEGAS